MAVKVYSHDVALAVEELTKDMEELIDSNVSWVFDLLVRTTPIDTEEMQSSWHWKKVNRLLWVIRNEAEHSSIIARGRRFINGRAYGSVQNGWGKGLNPFLRKFDKKLEKEFNAKQY